MIRRRLPVGIHYVNKTLLIRWLVDGGCHYFLFRLRRCGKSLPLDTSGPLFACQESLFRGGISIPTGTGSRRIRWCG